MGRAGGRNSRREGEVRGREQNPWQHKATKPLNTIVLNTLNLFHKVIIVFFHSYSKKWSLILYQYQSQSFSTTTD